MPSKFPGEIDYEDYDLTPRETEILNFAALGLTNREIASVLFITVETVKSHFKRIRLKVRTKTTARVTTKIELINAAWELGLLTTHSQENTKFRFQLYRDFQERKRKRSQESQ